MYQIHIYIILFMIYSVLGWLLEVTCKLIEEKKFINRGFLIGPYCPIYGYGALIITIFLSKYNHEPFTLFIMTMVSCSILEYFTSYFLEKIFHTRWWDYSRYKFNINGRICLETMIPFGIFGLLVINVLNPFFLNIIQNFSPILLQIVGTIFILIYIIDNLVSFKIIKNIQKISKDTQKKQIIFKDDTERITKLVKKRIESSKKSFEKRMIHAFPNLQIQKEKFKQKK